MYLQSQNVQGNHVAINDCDQVFRLREPRGDRACIWEAEDGTDHALIGLDNEDLVVSSSIGVAGHYCVGLNYDHVFVLLTVDNSLVFDSYEQKLLETPLGPIFYSPFGTFHWVIGDEVWTDKVEVIALDFVVLDGFNPENQCAIGSCVLVIGQGSHALKLDPTMRKIELGPHEPAPIAHQGAKSLKILIRSLLRTVQRRFWN